MLIKCPSPPKLTLCTLASFSDYHIIMIICWCTCTKHLKLYLNWRHFMSCTVKFWISGLDIINKLDILSTNLKNNKYYWQVFGMKHILTPSIFCIATLACICISLWYQCSDMDALFHGGYSLWTKGFIMFIMLRKTLFPSMIKLTSVLYQVISLKN